MQEIKEEIKLLSELTDLQQNEILPKLQFLLNEIELSEIVYSKRIQILIEILNLCKEYDSSSLVVKTVLIRWCNHDLDPDGVLGDLAANSDCPDNLLSFLVTKFKYSNPVTILDTHIRTRYGQGMIFSYTADRVLNAYASARSELNAYASARSELNAKSVDASARSSQNELNLSKHEWSILVEAINDTNKEIEELNSESNFWVKERLIDIQSNPMTQGNQDILDYIKDKISKLNSNKSLVVKKPEWVKQSQIAGIGDSKETTSPDSSRVKQSPIPFEEENQDTKDEEYYELKNMLASFNIREAPLPGAKEASLPDPDEAPDTDSLIQNFISLGKNKVSNENLNVMFRRYGPENAILGFSCLGCPQGKEGPCRMFYCVCREFDDEDIDNEFLDEEIDGSVWFSGECDVCEAKIQKLQYAVRFPVDGGGWLGCYCSFGCLRKTKVRPIYESDNFRIRDIQESLNTFGIDV